MVKEGEKDEKKNYLSYNNFCINTIFSFFNDFIYKAARSMTVIPVWKKWPSFKNEIIYRFIIDSLCRLITALSFRNEDVCPTLRKAYRFIADRFADSQAQSFRNDCRIIIFKWEVWFSFWNGIGICLGFSFRFMASLFGMTASHLFEMTEGIFLSEWSGRSPGWSLFSMTGPLPHFGSGGGFASYHICKVFHLSYHWKEMVFRP